MNLSLPILALSVSIAPVPSVRADVKLVKIKPQSDRSEIIKKAKESEAR